MLKICSRCKIENPKFMYKRLQLCRSCYSKDRYLARRHKIKEKREANKEKLQKWAREYHWKNREERIIKTKEWREKNKDKVKEYNKKYKKENRLSINTRKKTRRKEDPMYCVIENLRSRISHFVSGKDKADSISKSLGCTYEELKLHLESKFQPGMTWYNYGLFGWHVDHIRPIDSFDLTDPAQFKKACHYTNLQPLWAEDNIKKGSMYV